MFELALGRLPWSRAEVLSMPVSVRRGHIARLRAHLEAVEQEIEKARGG